MAELPTPQQVRIDSRGLVRLSDAPVDSTVRIVEIGIEHADRLIAHGLRTGSLVSIEGDAPFRGPRIVCLGRARIAIGRSVSDQVLVEPHSDHHVQRRR